MLHRQMAKDADFYLVIGIVLLVMFLPTNVILIIESLYQTIDIFPGAKVVLPWAIGLSSFCMVLGMTLVFLGIKYLVMPGTRLYRLTHLGR